MAKGQVKQVASKIDIEDVKKLSAMQCTMEEMSHFLGCSIDTLERNFAATIKEGRSKGKISVKRALFDKAIKGDLGAMVWWGKNFAGMSDKLESKTEVFGKEVESMTDEQLDAEIAKMEKEKGKR